VVDAAQSVSSLGRSLTLPHAHRVTTDEENGGDVRHLRRYIEKPKQVHSSEEQACANAPTLKRGHQSLDVYCRSARTGFTRFAPMNRVAQYCNVKLSTRTTPRSLGAWMN
jgi:hypothetical protein